MKKYTVTKDVERTAPKWLSDRINYYSIKIVYCIIDGAMTLKGVRIDGKLAEVGDTICFDGKRIFIERR